MFMCVCVCLCVCVCECVYVGGWVSVMCMLVPLCNIWDYPVCMLVLVLISVAFVSYMYFIPHEVIL